MVNYINSSVSSVVFYIREQYWSNDLEYWINLLRDIYNPLSITDWNSNETTAPAAFHLCLYSTVSIKFTSAPGLGVADRSDFSPSTAVNALESKPDPQTVTCVHSWMSKANDSNSMRSRNWCETNMNTLGFTIRWTIANFSCCHLEVGAYLESPTFTSGPTDSRKWCLEFYPKSSEENEDTVALFLNHVEEPNPDAPEVKAKFKACILDGNEEKKYERGGVALRNYSGKPANMHAINPANKQACMRTSQRTSKQACKQASQQTNKQANKQASKPACKQASQQASKRSASERASKQASKRMQPNNLLDCLLA